MDAIEYGTKVRNVNEHDKTVYTVVARYPLSAHVVALWLFDGDKFETMFEADVTPVNGDAE
jgi:hypothetical protein